MMRRMLALVVFAGCVLMACTPKTPEQRYDERMSRLAEKIEELNEQIQEEQQKEMERRRNAPGTPR